MKIRFTTRNLFGVVFFFVVLAALIGHQFHRERQIEHAISLMNEVPDNTWLGCPNGDPTSVARAVNFLISIDRQTADDALQRFARNSPDRNNLETLASLLVIPENDVSLSSAMRMNNGLVFTVYFSGGSRLGDIRPNNENLYYSNLKYAKFRDSKISLPQSPIQTLKLVLEGLEEIDKFLVIRQLIRAADGDFKEIKENCSSADELIRKLTRIGITLDAEQSIYALKNNAG